MLEGPDASGKTTLAKALKELTGGRHLHLTYLPEPEMWPQQARSLYSASVTSNERLTIIDRHYPSDWIYGKIYRGGKDCVPSGHRSHDRVLLKHGAINVVCMPPLDVVVEAQKEKHAKGEEMYEPDQRIVDVACMYAQLAYGNTAYTGRATYVDQLIRHEAAKHRHDWMAYDRTQFPGDKIYLFAAQLLDQLTERRARQPDWALDASLHNLCGYLPAADTLFVGDITNFKVSGGRDFWPFYGHPNSSGFLNTCLDAVEWPEERGVWCNARTNKESEATLTRLLEDRLWRRVICLGQEAYAAAMLPRGGYRNQEIHSLMHPSYARRFGHRDKFTASLRNALA